MIKVAEHSFLVAMRYSSLFSNHWQLGSQNWQDTSSAKKDYILICFIGLGTTMATQLVVNQKIQLLDFFHHLSLENPEKYWPIDTGLVKSQDTQA